ncbi:IS3 family transposase [Oceanobacillus sp. CFH 90083]
MKKQIEEYIHWYNHERAKEKLAGLSPVKISNSIQPINCII